MQQLQVFQVKGQRVLTTEQLATSYGTERKVLQNNFAYNRKRYIEGKHFVSLEKDDLKAFKGCHEIQGNLKYTHILYLWTEKGALLHAKSLNTDKAWEVYDYLVDFYFRAKEEVVVPKETKSATMTVVDVPENPQILNAIQTIQDDLICMRVLLDDCKKYLSEETYRERRKAAAEIVHIIVNDWSKLFDLKPKLIQKQY